MSPFEMKWSIHFKLNLSLFDLVTIWNKYKPVTILIWSLDLHPFRPSLQRVTFVTLWRLGLKYLDICHQKKLSNGDDPTRFTIMVYPWYRGGNTEGYFKFLQCGTLGDNKFISGLYFHWRYSRSEMILAGLSKNVFEKMA